MRYIAALLAVAMFSVGTAYAGTGGGQNMAGCGLGALVFKDNNNTKGAQSTAATTNGTFYSQWFGITSGTSGCTGDTWWAMKDRDVFVAVNYRNLSKELSAGEGEVAVAFAEVMGCGKAVPDFLSFTKHNHEALFPKNGTPAQMLETLEGSMAGTELAGACTL
jgi:hypothetical protein